MVDNSENDSAERIATTPEIMKERITAGPAYLAAAFPLRTNIPAPDGKIQCVVFRRLSSISLTNDSTDANAG